MPSGHAVGQGGGGLVGHVWSMRGSEQSIGLCMDSGQAHVDGAPPSEKPPTLGGGKLDLRGSGEK